jgi:hypothetical protein
MRYGSGKFELGLRLCERVRGDAFVPVLRYLSTCRYLLLLAVRGAVGRCRGRLPPAAGEELAQHCLEFGGE